MFKFYAKITKIKWYIAYDSKLYKCTSHENNNHPRKKKKIYHFSDMSFLSKLYWTILNIRSL